MNKETEIKEELMSSLEEGGNQKTKLSVRIKKWFIVNSLKPIAEKTLYFISFVDSFFSPMPPDPFLGFLTIFNPKKWFRFVVGTTLFGVIGGLVGYAIGFLAFEFIGEHLVALYEFEESLHVIGEAFIKNSFWTIFIAAFTPIPYQVFTVTAGLFKINIFVFILASIAGRGIRYLIVALVMRFIGEKFGKTILKYFNWLLLLGGLLIIVYILFL